MLKKSIYIPYWQLQALIPIAVFAPLCYAGAMKKIPAYLFIMTIPVLGRVTNYFFKKYYASKPPAVERVGDELIIRGIFSRLIIDINILKSLNVSNNFFSRTLDIKMLTVQTVHNESIRIFITQEASETLATIMPGISG